MKQTKSLTAATEDEDCLSRDRKQRSKGLPKTLSYLQGGLQSNIDEISVAEDENAHKFKTCQQSKALINE